MFRKHQRILTPTLTPSRSHTNHKNKRQHRTRNDHNNLECVITQHIITKPTKLNKQLSKQHSNHTYPRNQTYCKQIYEIYTKPIPGIQTHFQQHTRTHKAHPTKDALCTRKRWPTYTYPS